MRILIACEESQAVCKAFREKGHEAYSCDLLDCSGGHPEWHIKGDAIKEAYSCKYDMMIAHPPCTHLAVSGAAWFKQKIADGRQQEGIDFFLRLCEAPIEKICVENPISIMSSIYKKPNQIIHPYYFGDKFSKQTCLWLKNLPKLIHHNEDDMFYNKTHTDKGEFIEWKDKNGKTKRMAKWFNDARNGDHGHKRSKTFPGIAKAMVDAWG